MPDLIYHYVEDWKYEQEKPSFELYYDRSKEDRYRIRLVTDPTFNPRYWELYEKFKRS
jgi:hypothetical protein